LCDEYGLTSYHGKSSLAQGPIRIAEDEVWWLLQFTKWITSVGIPNISFEINCKHLVGDDGA